MIGKMYKGKDFDIIGDIMDDNALLISGWLKDELLKEGKVNLLKCLSKAIAGAMEGKKVVQKHRWHSLPEVCFRVNEIFEGNGITVENKLPIIN